MKSFIEFFTLNEGGKFRDSPNLKHEKDYPMFSIFTDRTDPKFEETTQAVEDNAIKLQNAFWAARKEINKIGFPSMHANVIFKTFKGGHSGAALGSSDHNTSKPKNWEDRRRLKHMEINNMFIPNLNSPGYYQDLVDTIVHEWSHLWMFDHGLEFRRAMDQYHEALINSNLDTIKPNTSVLDYDKLYSDLANVFYSSKDNNILNLSYRVSDVLEEFLQTTGPFYRHIPQEFIDKTAGGIVAQMVDVSDAPFSSLTNIKRSIKSMDVKGFINKYLTKHLKLDPDRVGEKFKRVIAKKINFPSAYGLQDSDETFAVAIEKFNQLDPYHKKRIVELMQVR